MSSVWITSTVLKIIFTACNRWHFFELCSTNWIVHKQFFFRILLLLFIVSLTRHLIFWMNYFCCIVHRIKMSINTSKWVIGSTLVTQLFSFESTIIIIVFIVNNSNFSSRKCGSICGAQTRFAHNIAIITWTERRCAANTIVHIKNFMGVCMGVWFNFFFCCHSKFLSEQLWFCRQNVKHVLFNVI